MKSSGSGDVQICVQNLLRLSCGEVPYERVKGISTRHIDSPTVDADPEIMQDAEWLIETYEPRAAVDGITISRSSEDGVLSIQANISQKEA